MSENISLPFGATISGESVNLAGSATKKRFTSYDRSDTTKLDYAVNRHYSSAQGRFTQVDPIGMSATSLGNPQSLNLYAYCGNDPINCVDPSGLFALLALAPEASATPVGAIIFWTAVAVIGVLRLIFGGQAKAQTRIVGQSSQRFAPIESSSRGDWITPSIRAGVGALRSFDKKEAQKKADERRRTSDEQNKAGRISKCHPSWEQVKAAFEEFASAIGATYKQVLSKEKNPWEIVSGKTPDELDRALRTTGWKPFKFDYDPDHWGAVDYSKNSDGQWYHISVSSTIVDGHSKEITIHWEEARPGTRGHFRNYVWSKWHKKPIWTGLPEC